MGNSRAAWSGRKGHEPHELSVRVVRNMQGSHKKSAPRLVLPGFNPSLVIGGARSRNHKKSRLSMTHVGHISWTDLQCMQDCLFPAGSIG
jgi:hypothetical protein